MNHLTLSTQSELNATLLSNTFIDTFMPQANGEFIKVYIYLLRCVSGNQRDVSVSGLADMLNQTEADIIRALRYWDKVGAVAIHFNHTDNQIQGIVFLDLVASDERSSLPNPSTLIYRNEASPAQNAVTLSAPTKEMSSFEDATKKTATHDYVSVSDDAHVTPITVEKKAPVRISSMYTPQQIQELSSQDDFSMLLYAVGAYLGGSLNPSEASCIAYFYDSLHFPSDLIEYLVEYCVSKNHKSMRYIEKVALGWANSGISTVKEAKMEVASHSDTAYSIMNAFGISNRDPGQRERDYIHKWTNIYNFESDIIIEACNRTLKATHQPSFEYADSILTKWKTANIKSSEDIKEADAQYEMSRSTAKKSPNSGKGNANRFNNFHQRDTDIETLERSLITNNG